MGVSPLIAVVAVVVFFIAVSLVWWLRYQEKKTVARNVSRRPHPYVGRMANNIYRIPLSRNYIYQTPPPTFSKAVKYPVPPPNKSRVSVINVYPNEEAPPPTYDQYVKTHQMQGTYPPCQQSHCSDFI